jgi:threonine dehydratase
VDEDAIADAIRLVVSQHSMLVEGAGALAVACLLAAGKRLAGQRVVLVLSGARIAANKLTDVLSG